MSTGKRPQKSSVCWGKKISKLIPDGLFGGLLTELKVDAAGLLRTINSGWDRLSTAPVTDIADIGSWRRGGSETYVAEARLEYSDGTAERIIAKAFVGWGVPPEQQQLNWESRRKRISARCVPVPHLYAMLPAVSIEQFISSDIADPEHIRAPTALQLGKIARELSNLNLQPTALWADVRLEEELAYLVDLGSDIAESNDQDDWVFRLQSALAPSAAEAFNIGFGIGCFVQ